MGHIFISYSRDNQPYARRLAEDIRNHGFDVWIDDRIDYGDRWFDEIEKAIDACNAFVIIMTPASRGSKWVQREILIADRDNKPIFPLLLEGREFGSLIDLQSVDVVGQKLPAADFYQRLSIASRPANRAGRLVAPAGPPSRKSAKAQRLPWLISAAVALLVVVGIIGAAVMNRGGSDANLELAAEPTNTVQGARGVASTEPSASPMASETPIQILPTNENSTNVILEITEAGTRLFARTTPTIAEDNVQDMLFWGDRVLWRGKTVSGDGVNWLEVQIATGETVYVAYNADYYVERDLTHSMDGLEVGATIRILADGDGGHLRETTSTTSRQIERLNEGDTLTVTAGPINAEYYLWWKLELPDGRTGYAVEVPGWWSVE